MGDRFDRLGVRHTNVEALLRRPGIGHNNGPTFDMSWEAWVWRRASARAWKAPKPEVAMMRLKRAERLGIPWELHDHRLQPNREQLDQALVQAFRTASVDLVVMAGWMRVVTPILIGAFPNRLINIHPSLLPSFRGLDAVGQALAAGVTLAGCTAHLVSEEVDAGRILVQAAVPVLSGDDHASLSRRIQVQEHRILPLAVALAAQG